MYLCAWCRSPAGNAKPGPLPQCPDCSVHTVQDDARAREIFAEVVSWIESVFGPGRLREVRMTYGTLPSGNGSVASVGRTEFLHLNGVSRLSIATIKDLPDFVLAATFAHELGHVLLFVNDKTLDPNPQWPTDDEVVEGFCEVVASEWLESRTDRRSRVLRRMMDTNPTPVYGPGFRMMRSEFDRAGNLVLLRAELTGTSAGLPAPPTIPVRPAIPTPVPSTVQASPVGDVERHRPIIRIERPPAPTVRAPDAPHQPAARPVIPMKSRPDR